MMINELKVSSDSIEALCAKMREEITPIIDDNGNSYFCVSCGQRAKGKKCNFCHTEELTVPIPQMRPIDDLIQTNMQTSDEVKLAILKALKAVAISNQSLNSQSGAT